MSLVSQELQQILRQGAELLEPGPAWPQSQVQALQQAGVLRWTIPRRCGGQELSDAELLQGYLKLSRHCLCTAFLLTQHNAAVHRIAGGGSSPWRDTLLRGITERGLWCTVGISHFSTSRQHLQNPPVRALPSSGGGWTLTGTVPWVTGAAAADWLITGGVLPDHQQILLAIPRETPGLEIEAPLPLMALNATCTGRIHLHDVAVESEWLVAGPAEQVMKVGTQGGTGSLTTSALALGAAQRTLERFAAEAAARESLREVVAALTDEATAIETDLLSSARSSEPGRAEELRFRANSLVTRVSQAYLAACKGAGYVQGHPAERAVREAMFFQVWSCPQAVLNNTLNELSCRE